ncbi:MAG: hypothetical protein JXQ91_14565 [Vannielia sp.]|uniref:hypothetical protein n=1 Tax=Vannielia sp. TaxID=2813045 RepID=UPI003B8C31B4
MLIYNDKKVQKGLSSGGDLGPTAAKSPLLGAIVACPLAMMRSFCEGQAKR